MGGEAWEKLGSDYQDLATTWRRVDDIILNKASKGPQTLENISTSNLPARLIAAGRTLMEMDDITEEVSLSGFPGEMKAWVGSISKLSGEEALQEKWTYAGPAGLALPLLGMKWWHDCNGPTGEWKAAKDMLQAVFNKIMNADSL